MIYLTWPKNTTVFPLNFFSNSRTKFTYLISHNQQKKNVANLNFLVSSHLTHWYINYNSLLCTNI